VRDVVRRVGPLLDIPRDRICARYIAAALAYLRTEQTRFRSTHRDERPARPSPGADDRGVPGSPAVRRECGGPLRRAMVAFLKITVPGYVGVR